MFSLKILTDFAAAHSLRGYPGNCANLHGHNWQLEIVVMSDHLDDSGMVLDFRTIKEYSKVVINRLDHKYINEVIPFNTINPTAENIAKYLCDEINILIQKNGIWVYSVSVWETARACATYINNQSN